MRINSSRHHHLCFSFCACPPLAMEAIHYPVVEMNFCWVQLVIYIRHCCRIVCT
jgi:hypothetical protein